MSCRVIAEGMGAYGSSENSVNKSLEPGFSCSGYRNQSCGSLKPATCGSQNCFGLLPSWALCMGHPEPEVGQVGRELHMGLDGCLHVNMSPEETQCFHRSLRREASLKATTGARGKQMWKPV